MADLERMKLAFRYHFTQVIVAADGRLFHSEVKALTALDSEMKEHALMDEDGVLALDFSAVRDAALQELASALPDADKHHIVRDLLRVASVDGDEHDTELAEVREAAAVLGMTEDAVTAARA